jgi:anti-sigma B factor antagonist
VACSEPLELSTRTGAGDVLVVAPSGELDLRSVDALADVLRDAHDRGQPVELDLSALSFMDSTGLSLLIETAQDAKAHGWPLRIRDPSEPVAHVIEMTRTREALGLGDPEER